MQELYLEREHTQTEVGDCCVEALLQGREGGGGGFGIKSLRVFNDASDLKQCWSVLNSREDWGNLLGARLLMVINLQSLFSAF